MNSKISRLFPSSLFFYIPKYEIGEKYKLAQIYSKDQDRKKVCLFLNELRNEADQPVMLPVIRKCIKSIAGRDCSNPKNLLSFVDPEVYSRLCLEFLFGKDAKIINEGKCWSIPCLSNYGSFTLGAKFLHKLGYSSFIIEYPDVYGYSEIFKAAGFSVQYTFHLPEVQSKAKKYTNIIADLENAPIKSVIVFTMCGFDPTGMDPTTQEWEVIFKLIHDKELFPFVEGANHGLISGNTETDSYFVRVLVERGLDFFLAQSFSWNMGLSSERPSNLVVVQKNLEIMDYFKRHLTAMSRISMGNPGFFGMILVRYILGDPELRKLFHSNLMAIVEKNNRMRATIISALKNNRSVADDQKGIFLDLELQFRHVFILLTEYHIYIPSNGRIYLAGLNNQNIDYVCKALFAVLVGRAERLDTSSAITIDNSRLTFKNRKIKKKKRNSIQKK